MPFDSDSAKEAGRKSKRGTNKVTSKLKADVTELTSTILDDLQNEYTKGEMTIQEKMNFVIKLLPFCLPKKSSNLKVNWSALDESEQAEVLEQLKSMLKDE